MWHAHSNVQISAVANLIIALYNSGAITDKTKFSFKGFIDEINFSSINDGKEEIPWMTRVLPCTITTQILEISDSASSTSQIDPGRESLVYSTES